VKNDLLHLVNAKPSDPDIDENEHQIYLNRLMIFKQNRGKNWSSRANMIESFVHEMKFLYCSVHAFHEQVFDKLWFGPKISSTKKL